MRKSPAKVIELFVYALLVILAVVFAMTHGGLNAPIGLFPPSSPTAAIETGSPAPNTKTEQPIYNPPPKSEFSPR